MSSNLTFVIMNAAISSIPVVKRVIILSFLYLFSFLVSLNFLRNAFAFFIASIAVHSSPHAPPMNTKFIRKLVPNASLLGSNPIKAPNAMSSFASPPPHCPV